MKRLTVLGLALGLLAGSRNLAWGYEVETHEDMSQKAVEASLLAKDPRLLANLGLQSLSNKQKFPNSKNSDEDIVGLFRDGARFEDDGVRSVNHFYDPRHFSGLPGVYVVTSSPYWALEDIGDFSMQKFSYKDARQYFYDALTKPTNTERDQNFGLTFQTLGQVIHHLQDMAQPQHVRNDAHCDAIFPCLIPGGLVGLFSPSLYEKYTKDIGSGLLFADTSYNPANPVYFYTPRQFWTGGLNNDGRGIADFTNRNFVSAGTNFTGTATNISPNANYPLPSGISAVVSSRQITDADLLGPNQPLSGEIDFIGTPVTDAYRPTASGFNERTSSYSLFDADLTAIGADKTFTLNRFNFDAAHPFLIPRAVGYSAGLIDYFFRGKIDMVPIADSCCSFNIQNLTDEYMSGTFSVYYDDVDGNRRAVTGADWVLFISPHSLSTPVLFAPPQLGSIKPAHPNQYLLVFKGSLGSESSPNFAVTAKVVTLMPKLASPAKWVVAGTVKSTGTAFNRSLGDTRMFSVENGVAKPVTAGVVSTDTTLFLNLAGGIPASLRLAPIGSNPQFSVAPGADIAKFSLKENMLQFIYAPDFDTPTDENLDNTYVVNITTTDQSGLTDTQKIEATVKLMYNVTKTVTPARLGTATIRITDTTGGMIQQNVNCYTYGQQYADIFVGGGDLWGKSPFLGTASAWSTNPGAQVVTREVVPYTTDEELLQLMKEALPQLPFSSIRAIATSPNSTCQYYADDGCPDASICANRSVLSAQEFAQFDPATGYPSLIRLYSFGLGVYVNAVVEFPTTRPVPARTTYIFSPIADAALGIPYSKNTEGDVITERYTLITEQRIRPLTASF